VTDTSEKAPIEVNASAVPEQVSSAFRTLLVAVGGYMAGRGWIDGNIAAALVPVIVIGVPFAWGQLRLFKVHGERVVMAAAADDDVAKVVTAPPVS